MPGIAGTIGRKGSHDENRAMLEAMLKPMAREAFYSTGSYANRELGLYGGWVSPSGTFSDCLPLWNEQRDVALLFYGEDFAAASTAAELRVRGHRFETGNASYLVHSYEESGLGFLEKINGTFCGLLADLRQRKIALFNDRYGVNRIYFHENEEGFYFSSEAKSLLKVLPGLRALEPRALGEFVACGCVLQNRTLFRGISLLPAGSVWTFSPGQTPNKDAYFRRETWEQKPALEPAQYYEKCKETWQRILPRYFNGKQPIALSLTGGVDSRMILAWAKAEAGRLPCYTFGGSYRDCADVKISREVANISHQKHEVISVGREFLSRFPEWAQKAIELGDGAMDVTGSIDVYVQGVARQIAPVRVTGTNGGEILRALVAFKPSALCEEALAPELAGFMDEAARTYDAELKGNPLSFTAFKQAPWFMSSKFSLERAQLTLRMPYFDNELVELVFQAPAVARQNNDLSLRLIAEANPALGALGTDRGGNHSIPGVEQALSFLGEFSFKAEYAYDYGMPQWLARFDHLLAPLHLERLFLGRHKFAHFRIWYREQLGDYVKSVLLDPRTLNRALFRGPVVEKLVTEHVRGVRNYTRELHKLLSIELIQRHLLEQN